MPDEIRELYEGILEGGYHLAIDNHNDKWFCDLSRSHFEYGHYCDNLLLTYGLWNNAKHFPDTDPR